jgi:hypothetical protein
MFEQISDTPLSLSAPENFEYEPELLTTQKPMVATPKQSLRHCRHCGVLNDGVGIGEVAEHTSPSEEIFGANSLIRGAFYSRKIFSSITKNKLITEHAAITNSV